MAVLLAQLVVVLTGPIFLATILLGLPGTWMVLGTAALCEWLTDAQLFDRYTLAVALGLALCGELWELLAGATGAKRAGGSRASAFGAFAGGIVGAIVGTFTIPVPLVGTLAGGGIGAFVVATLVEESRGRETREAVRIGRAAGIGHVFGLLGKLALGTGVWILLSVTAFVP